MGIAESLIISKLENTPFWAPAAIVCGIVSATWCLLNWKKVQAWKPLMVAIPACALGLILFVLCLFLSGTTLLYGLSLILVGLPWILCGALYYWNQMELSQLSPAKAEEHQFDDISAIKKLNSLSTKYMAPRQKYRIAKRKIVLLVKLGNLTAAKALLDKIQDDKVLFYFIQHMISYLSGDMKQAKEYAKLTEDSVTSDTDKHLLVQVLLNHGVSYVTMNNYQIAEDYFKKAAAAYQESQLQDTGLLNTVYYNWLFNQTRILPPEEAKASIAALLTEYEAQIDPNAFADKVQLYNLKLEMLRQLEGSRQQISDLTDELFTAMMSADLPMRNKCLLAKSITRVVWTGRLNPEPCLQFFRDHLDELSQLPPQDRYDTYKELRALFSDLNGPIVERYSSIKDRTQQYFPSEAEADLEQWSGSLPSEAVIARCRCLKEKALLQRMLPQHNREKSARCMKDAIDLYHENGLYLDEGLARLDYVDELFALENMDKNCRPLQIGEITAQLEAVEAFLPKFVEHPALAEFSIRCGFYYSLLDRYGKCIACYQNYRKSQIALKHFTPGIHQYVLALSLQVRTLYFCQAIRDIVTQKANELERVAPGVKAWFETFPNHEGTVDSVVLNQFLAYPAATILKKKLWISKPGDTVAQSHTWLYIERLGMNLDITYPQFENEPDCQRIFFDIDRHPFESQEANVIQQSRYDTHMVFQLMARAATPDALTPEQQDICNQILNLVSRFLPEDCPTPEEIAQLHKETMEPIFPPGAN